MKQCTDSSHEGSNSLPLEAFYRSARNPDGRDSRCSECAKRRSTEWYAANVDRARDTREKYRQAHGAELREKDRAYWDANQIELNQRQRDRYKATREENLKAQASYRNRVRAQIFGHYGWSCACCGSTVRLQIDHIDGNGTQHRRELFGDSQGASGTSFYIWLIRNAFPDCFQTLCHPCNASKRTGTHCRLKHAA